MKGQRGERQGEGEEGRMDENAKAKRNRELMYLQAKLDERDKKEKERGHEREEGIRTVNQIGRISRVSRQKTRRE